MPTRRNLLILALLNAIPRVRAQAPRTLTVSAAASLTDVLRTIGADYEAAHPLRLRFNFGASGALLQQIAQGAPVDVFISADEETVDRGIVQQLLMADTRRDIAANMLVLIAPIAQPDMSRLGSLAGPAVSRIAIGKPLTVPAGRYARQALEHAGLWESLQQKLVYADSVRQVLDYVARGEAQAGFVYATDAALMSDRVRVVTTATGHAPIRYPAIVVAGSRDDVGARGFVEYLTSAAAQDRLAAAGFARFDR